MIKNFFKNNLKTVVVAIITSIICIGGTAFAAFQYNAKQVEYKEGKSVETALNELYVKLNNSNYKGNLLYENVESDFPTMKSISYTFTNKTTAFMVVSAKHFNGNSNYFHQINTPIISNGAIEKIYNIGDIDIETRSCDFSQYIYKINADTNTVITINAKAYGWGHVYIDIFE